MTNSNTLEEIIEFAIEEELSAEKLYSDAADNHKGTELEPILRDMANMEKGHAVKLKAFYEGSVSHLGKTENQNLKISDYLVDVEITPQSSIQDILIFSMKCEQKAVEMYTHLQEEYTGQAEKDLFSKLAREELKHKNDLEKLYDDFVYQEN